MKKLKIILIVLLLAGVTCVVVFVPQLLSGQKDISVLNQVSYRTYDASNRAQLTGHELAKLCINQEITSMYNPVTGSGKDEIMPEHFFFEVLEQVFGKDEYVCNFLESLAKQSLLSAYDNQAIANNGNKPVAVNFICCSSSNLDCLMEFIYEEKTATILEVSLNLDPSCFADENEIATFAMKTDALLCEHFENTLGLSKHEYSQKLWLPGMEQNEMFYIKYTVV